MISKSAIAIAIAILSFFFLTNSESSLEHEIIRQTPPLAHRLLNWVRMKTNTLPNLDFRAPPPPAPATAGGGGAGEKVKEAVAMSIGESKATLEESAKSAAQVTKEKLKDVFSNSNTNSNSKQDSEL